MKLDLIEKYKMSPEEHKVVFDKLKKEIFFDKAIEKNPSVCLLLVSQDVEKPHL